MLFTFSTKKGYALKIWPYFLKYYIVFFSYRRLRPVYFQHLQHVNGCAHASQFFPIAVQLTAKEKCSPVALATLILRPTVSVQLNFPRSYQSDDMKCEDFIAIVFVVITPFPALSFASTYSQRELINQLNNVSIS